MERADADELTTFFLEHDMLTDHIDDVGPFLDGFDRAGVETRQAQARLLRGYWSVYFCWAWAWQIVLAWSMLARALICWTTQLQV